MNLKEIPQKNLKNKQKDLGKTKVLKLYINIIFA